MKYALVSQRKKVEDELNKRDEYHMPDQEPGQTMSKKYEMLTARYRSAHCPAMFQLDRVSFLSTNDSDGFLSVTMHWTGHAGVFRSL